MNQSNFLICYEYIKNNSYINLDDILEFSDPLVMQ